MCELLGFTEHDIYNCIALVRLILIEVAWYFLTYLIAIKWLAERRERERERRKSD